MNVKPSTPIRIRNVAEIKDALDDTDNTGDDQDSTPDDDPSDAPDGEDDINDALIDVFDLSLTKSISTPSATFEIGDQVNLYHRDYQ